MNLEIEDFDLLLEALEAWEKIPSSSGTLAGMLGAMMADSKEDGMRRLKESRMNAEDEERSRKEIATCLKAKLYLMKNDLESSTVLLHKVN